MNNHSLLEFSGALLAKTRITFGDVKRLQRDILPDGVTSRQEAEILLGLERAIVKTDRSWADYLVSAIVEYVVWTERPTGCVDEDAMRWIAEALGAEPRTRTSARLLHEIAAEAHMTSVSETPCETPPTPALNPAAPAVGALPQA